MSKPSALSACLSLSDFLNTMHDKYWVFDMGCRLSALNKSTFLAFENCQQSYPNPWLKHAWVGCVMQYAKTTRIWFLKLPLDEQGMLIQASRDEFLQQLLMTLGLSHQTLDKTHANNPTIDSQALDTCLKNSPLAFTPDESLMAAFHARINQLLKHPTSNYFDDLITYLNSKDLSQGWQALGLQGLADLAQQLTCKSEYSQLLIKRWPHIPTAVAAQLAIQCEHIVPHFSLASLFLQQGKNMYQKAVSSQTTTSQNITDITSCLPYLRAISQAKAAKARQQWISELLMSVSENNVELLALVASKCQYDLKQNTQVLAQFLQAASYQQPVFNGLVGELMYQPSLRQAILNAVRKPDRNPQIAQAFGQMLT